VHEALSNKQQTATTLPVISLKNGIPREGIPLNFLEELEEELELELDMSIDVPDQIARCSS